MDQANTQEKSTPLVLRRPVLHLLIIALFAELGYAVMNISTMPVYLLDDRHFGASTIGLVFVAYLISEAVFKSPMGHLSDKYGPRKLMLIGPSISVVTATLTFLVPRGNGSPLEVLAFIVLRCFDGLGAAMLWPAAFAEMNDIVNDGERQQAMSLLNLCYMLGIAVAFACGGAANDLTHTKYAGLIMAGVFFLGAAVSVYRFIPDGKLASSSSVVTEHTSGLADFAASLNQIPGYLLMAIVTFAGIGFPMAIFKIFPTDQFGFSETQIGALIAPGAIVMGLASVPMGQFADRIGRLRAIHLGLMLSTLGMIAISAGAFLPILRQPWVLACGGIPVGIGFLLTIPAWMASVSDIDPERRGANLGSVMTAQGIGAILGAPLGATMYEKLQPLGIQLGLGASFARYSPFLGCAACLGLGWLLSMKVLRDRPANESSSVPNPVHLITAPSDPSVADVAAPDIAVADIVVADIAVADIGAVQDISECVVHDPVTLAHEHSSEPVAPTVHEHPTAPSHPTVLDHVELPDYI